jgi:hypothetical protein
MSDYCKSCGCRQENSQFGNLHHYINCPDAPGGAILHLKRIDQDERNATADEIKALHERIEELEDASVKEVLDFGVEQLSRGHDKYHITTTDQIDAAWVYLSLADHGPEHCRVCGKNILQKLGIVRCEGCGGVGDREPYGMYQPNGDPTDPTWVKCPDCNGHGWVIGGDDE